MTARCSPPSNPDPLYFCEVDYGRLGPGFEPMDRDQMSRTKIVGLIRTGNIKPIKVLEVIEPCEDFPYGRCLDITDQLVIEAAIEREPRSLEELRQVLIDYQSDHDRDLRKHGVFGW